MYENIFGKRLLTLQEMLLQYFRTCIFVSTTSAHFTCNPPGSGHKLFNNYAGFIESQYKNCHL